MSILRYSRVTEMNTIPNFWKNVGGLDPTQGGGGGPKKCHSKKGPNIFSSNIGFMGTKMTGMIPRVTKKNLSVIG